MLMCKGLIGHMVAVAIEEDVYIVHATSEKIKPIAAQQQLFLNAYFLNLINILSRNSYIY